MDRYSHHTTRIAVTLNYVAKSKFLKICFIRPNYGAFLCDVFIFLLQNFRNYDVLSYVFWSKCDAVKHELYLKLMLTVRCSSCLYCIVSVSLSIFLPVWLNKSVHNGVA